MNKPNVCVKPRNTPKTVIESIQNKHLRSINHPSPSFLSFLRWFCVSSAPLSTHGERGKQRSRNRTEEEGRLGQQRGFPCIKAPAFCKPFTLDRSRNPSRTHQPPPPPPETMTLISRTNSTVCFAAMTVWKRNEKRLFSVCLLGYFALWFFNSKEPAILFSKSRHLFKSAGALREYRNILILMVLNTTH